MKVYKFISSLFVIGLLVVAIIEVDKMGLAPESFDLDSEAKMIFVDSHLGNSAIIQKNEYNKEFLEALNIGDTLVNGDDKNVILGFMSHKKQLQLTMKESVAGDGHYYVHRRIKTPKKIIFIEQPPIKNVALVSWKEGKVFPVKKGDSLMTYEGTFIGLVDTVGNDTILREGEQIMRFTNNVGMGIYRIKSKKLRGYPSLNGESIEVYKVIGNTVLVNLNKDILEVGDISERFSRELKFGTLYIKGKGSFLKVESFDYKEGYFSLNLEMDSIDFMAPFESVIIAK